MYIVHIYIYIYIYIYTPRAIVGLVTYFVVGGVYMYRVKGARGVEVVPNVVFWKDLPFLIKVCLA